MTFKHILCISDLTAASKNAEYAALKLAHRFNSKLTVLSCGKYDSPPPNVYFDENVLQTNHHFLHNSDSFKLIEQKKQETIQLFAEIQQTLNFNLENNIIYEVKLENEVSATLDLLEDKKNPRYDLIVVLKQSSSHWERFIFGSPAKEICDETKISTLLIPSGEQWKFWEPRGIVVGSVLNQSGEKIELLSSDIAKKFDSNLTLMHVLDIGTTQFNSNFSPIFPIDYIPPPNVANTSEEPISEIKKELNELANHLMQAKGIEKVKTHVEVGSVGENMINYLKSTPENNLLIIGSRGENALKRFFLGSNTDSIEEACPIPILIVFYPPS